jgi:hypothetical protein
MLRDIILIICVNLLFLWKTRNYYYVSDDIPVADRKEPLPKNFWHGIWIQFKGHRYFHEVQETPQKWDWYSNPKTAHCITMSVHIINCILIYLAFGHNDISLFASLLFAINPVNMQGGSIWVSGKPYSSATACTLLMYCLPWVAPAFYYATTLFSANALLSPVPFLLTKHWYWAILPLVAYGVLRKVVMKKWKLDRATNTEMTAIAWRKLIVVFKTYGYYMRICLMPYHLGLYHPFAWGIGVNKEHNKRAYTIDKDFYIGLALALLTLILIIKNSHNLLGFGLLWFVINIAMWCNLVTIQQQIAERYVYLSNVGLMLALAYVLRTLRLENFPYAYAFMPIVLTYYATRFWSFREAYANDYWMIEYNVAEMKDCHYAWVARGIKKFYFGDFDGALRDFGEARIHCPHDFKQNYNMAVMFLLMGDVIRAEEHLKYAEGSYYDGVAHFQKSEFIDHTRALIEQAKLTQKLEIKDVRIIK